MFFDKANIQRIYLSLFLLRGIEAGYPLLTNLHFIAFRGNLPIDYLVIIVFRLITILP